jgi:hypothetical protein
MGHRGLIMFHRSFHT